MKTNLLKTVFVFLIAVSGYKALAQNLSPVRHYIGVNYNIVAEDVKHVYLGTPYIGASIYGLNQQWVNNFGIIYEYSNNDSLSDTRSSSVIGRFNYYSYNSGNSYTPVYISTYNAIHDSIETGWQNSTSEVSYSVINLSLSWKKQIFKTPLYLSIGPNFTFIPTSSASADIKLTDYYIAEGQRFIPEAGVELSENNTRAKIYSDNLKESKWEAGLQFGVFIEFTAPNFLYNLAGKSSMGNSIIIAPNAIAYIAGRDLKEIFIEPQSWEEPYFPWRRSSLQAGLDIRMPMPF